jgi:hypothetical protein
MTNFFSLMFRLPLEMFASGMEAFSKAMREMQRTMGQGMAAMGGMANPASDPSPITDQSLWNMSMNGGPRAFGTDTELLATRQPTPWKEGDEMCNDQDLGGDDSKYVNFTILFTKRDYSVVLRQQEGDVVDYPTNGGSYGGIKIAHYLGDLASGAVDPPDDLVTGLGYDDLVPVVRDGQRIGWKFSRRDEKFVTFVYNVVNRMVKPDADYDRQTVDRLSGIDRGVGKIADSIG